MPDSDPYAALVGASPQLTQAAPPSTQPDEDGPYAALVQPPVSAPASPRLPAAGAAPSSGMPAWLRVPLGAGANLLGGAENALTELGHLVGMGGGYTSQLPGAEPDRHQCSCPKKPLRGDGARCGPRAWRRLGYADRRLGGEYAWGRAWRDSSSRGKSGWGSAGGSIWSGRAWRACRWRFGGHT